MEEKNHKILDGISSLTEIASLGETDSNFFMEVKEYSVKRTFDIQEPSFTIIINDLNYNISVTGGKFDEILSLERMQKNIKNTSKINLENSSTIIIFINELPIIEKLDKILDLSKNIAVFIEFLFENYFNATSLHLIYSSSASCPGLPLHILRLIESDRIKTLEGITINNIISYAASISLETYNILAGLPNLKEYSMNIISSTIRHPKMERKLTTFFHYLKQKNDCILKVTTNVDIEKDELLNTILKECEKINLVVNIKTNTTINDSLLPTIINISPYNIPNFIYHITKIEMALNLFDDYNHLQQILTVCYNLENIIIYVTPEFIDDILEKETTSEGIRNIVKNAFSFHGSLKKLNSIFINFEKSIRKVSDGKKSFIAFLFNAIMSVMPEKVTTMSMENVDFINIGNSRMITMKFPFITRLSLCNCENIPYDMLEKLNYLRYVSIYGDIRINIPSWVEIVIFRYNIDGEEEEEEDEEETNVDDNKKKEIFDSFYEYRINGNNDVKREIVTKENSEESNNKKNDENRPDEYYHKIMNRSFKSSIRYIPEGCSTDYIVFFDDIFRWHDYLEILDLFPLYT
uniref:KH domain-containing protein n=1 Tax=Parastrongyloides trichosuri TaxID=131310 RepID=A0A0N4ZLC8_PARTI